MNIVENCKSPQIIVVFQESGSGENKVRGIQRFGNGNFILEKITINESLPNVIDNTDQYFPETIKADLVLDYLKHPDLSYDLAAFCKKLQIPEVATRKKIRNSWTYSPPICCALSNFDDLGTYGQLFGAPEYDVDITDGIISKLSVQRGAPCGATWDAGEKIIGLDVDTAIEKIGLEAQFCCTANPADWDPINGKSPVHLAADFHSNALAKAVKNCCDNVPYK